MKKKLLAVYLACAMLSPALIGCSNGEGTGPQSEGTSSGEVISEQGSSESAYSNFNATGLPILKEKETYTIMVQQQSTIVKAGDKKCAVDAENDTNVQIDYQEIAPTAWKEKVNILFASNDLPDAFIGTGIRPEVNYKQLHALDDLIEKYGPNIQYIFESVPGLEEALVLPDGKIHSLPIGGNAPHNEIDSMMWVNKTWLDNLGMEIPTTTDEFYEMLKAFKTEDPNGNGKNDEIPYTFEKAFGYGTTIENFYGAFGVVDSDSHLFNKDGTLLFAPQEQGYYDTLEYLHKLYAEGLIDPDVFAMSQDQYNAKIKTPDLVGAFQEWGTLVSDTIVNIPALKGPNGDQMVLLNNAAIRQEGFSITTACEHPEVLVRWYDYCNRDEETMLNWSMGPKDEIWMKTDDSEYSWSFRLDALPEDLSSLQEWKNVSGFSGNAPVCNIYAKDEVVGPMRSDGDPKKDAVVANMEYGVYGPVIKYKTQEETEKLSLIQVDLDNYLNKFVSDSIINGIDEAKWQTHLDNLEQMNIQEYIDIYQKYE